MSAMVMALAFVACEKDEAPEVKDLKVSKDAIEVVIDGDAVVLDITGGVAPYKAEVAEIAEEATYNVTAEVKEGKVSIAAVTKEALEPQEGDAEGEETPEPVVVDVTITDAAKKTATIKVTVTPADDKGEGEGEGEE